MKEKITNPPKMCKIKKFSFSEGVLDVKSVTLWPLKRKSQSVFEIAKLTKSTKN
jgi:hypothetical protein